MPKWNLKEDFKSGQIFFSEPIEENISIYFLDVEEEAGKKKLIIKANNAFKVKAIVEGKINEGEEDGNYILKLETDFFKETNIRIPFDIHGTWYGNWIAANKIPGTIIYENVIPHGSIVGKSINAGDEIGASENVGSQYQIKLGIQYCDLKFIHPVEFFSLLFWREECDPLYKDKGHRQNYGHALLDKMMETLEGGLSVGDVDLECGSDDWLGLRPPLRTYKRVEWEAKRAHIFHHANWQSEGSLQDLFKNVMIKDNIGSDTNPDYYSGESKCNIFVGEMAFRAGFKVPVVPAPNDNTKLKYAASLNILKPCNDPHYDGKSLSSRGQISYNGKSYKISQPFGIRKYVNVDDSSTLNDAINEINRAINEQGRVFIYARKSYCYVEGGQNIDPRKDSNGKLVCDNGEKRVFHVFILSRIDSISETGISGKRIDQHCTWNNIPIDCNVPFCGCKDRGGRAFIELIPGGDPCEEWGMLDLNCLSEV